MTWLWFTLLVANFYPLIDGGLKQILIVLRGKKAIKASTEVEVDSENTSNISPPPEPVSIEPKY